MCICVCIYIYITRLASKEIPSPSNKIHWEVGRGEHLSAPLWGLAGLQVCSGHFGIRVKISSLLEIDTRFLDLPVRSLVTMPTDLSRIPFLNQCPEEVI
jgi:hypothetical protein